MTDQKLNQRVSSRVSASGLALALATKAFCPKVGNQVKRQSQVGAHSHAIDPCSVGAPYNVRVPAGVE